MTSSYRNIPSVTDILMYSEVDDLVRRHSHDSIVYLIREYLDEIRYSIAMGKPEPLSGVDLVEEFVKRVNFRLRRFPHPVINATGVILHTNLGRSPLSTEATEAIMDASMGYSDLELDLADGRRGSRQTHIENLLRQITGCEAALVMNNNAGGLLLALSAVTSGREVVLSRGESVEIGGGFRIPSVMEQSGANLVEIGTTNRTYISDYERVINTSTGALLKVHASNFRITGFTSEASLGDMVELGTRYGIPVIHDLGSGCLIDTSLYGLPHEVTPQESVGLGSDIVLFSGDKLLGGPQAGIILGKTHLIAEMASHPLARALRIDKVSLAALTATLMHYVNNEAIQKVPIWRMILMPIEDIKARAQAWQNEIGAVSNVVEGVSTIGGGSLPEETLRTWLLAIDSKGIKGGITNFVDRIRRLPYPLIARVERDNILFDPRTVSPHDDHILLDIIKDATDVL